MKYLTSSRFVRNVFAMASGATLAQVVTVAFSPLITRIYGPELFGLQGLFLSLVSVLSPVVALRYPMAIITAKTDDEAQKLAHLSLLVAVSLVTSIMWMMLLLGGQTITVLVGAEGLGNLIYFLPLALMCVALHDVMNFRAARLGVFRLVGFVAVLQVVVTNLARVVGGLWSPNAAVLIALVVVAPALKSAMLMIGAHDLRLRLTGLQKDEATRLLTRHRDFPVYRVPTDVLNSASQAVPVILLSALFTPIAAGLYVLARSILSLPMSVLGAAVGDVIYARYGELSREGRPLFPLLLRSTLALLCLAPVILALAWFAPPFFAFVFGEEWRGAGHYALWMALWLGVSTANVPAIRLAPVIEAQRVLLIANIVFLGARLLSMYGTARSGGSALEAVAAYSVVSAIANVALVLVLFLLCLRYDRGRQHQS